MSSVSGKSRFGARFSASFQTRFFRRGGNKRQYSATPTLRKQTDLTENNTHGVLQPQGLTPRGSSDSRSSGSGNSPTSTDPGSPPTISAPPLGLTGHNRPGYYCGVDGIETKKRRVSHFRKSETSGNNTIAATTTNKPIIKRQDGPPAPSSVFNSSSSSFVSSSSRSNKRKRESSPIRANPISVKSSTAPAVNNNHGTTLPPSNTSVSKDSDDADYHPFFYPVTTDEQRKRYTDDFNADYEEYLRLYPQALKFAERFDQMAEIRRRAIENGNRQEIEEIELRIRQAYDNRASHPLYITKVRFDYLHEKLGHLQRRIHAYDKKKSGVSSCAPSSGREPEPSNGIECPTQLLDNSTENSEKSASPDVCHDYRLIPLTIPPTSTSKTLDHPNDYQTYPIVSSEEQRKLYQKEIESETAEHRFVLVQISEIRKRFSNHLAEFAEKRLRGLDSDETERQIINVIRDPVHMEARKRLNYLHVKSTHLARLVSDYEKKHSGVSTRPCQS